VSNVQFLLVHWMWRSQNLVVVRALEKLGVWGGMSPPHEEWVWEGG